MKRKRSRLGLRSRLILILVAVFACLASLAMRQAREALNDDLAQEGSRLQAEANRIAAQHEIFVVRTDTLLQTLLRSSDFRNGRPASDCGQVLAKHRDIDSAIGLLGMASPDGRLLCASRGALPDMHLAEQKWFRNVVRRDDLVISDLIPGQPGDPPSLILGRAQRDSSGKVQAIFFAKMEIARLSDELAASVGGDNRRLALSDGDGTIVIRHPDPGSLVGKNIRQLPLLQRILPDRREGVSEETALDGNRRLVAHTPFFASAAGSHYQLLLSKPTADIETAIHQRLITSLAATLGLLLATLGLLYWGSDRYVVQPLRTLARVARRFGAGELEARSGLPVRDDEIGELTQALENMAVSLRESTVSHARLKAEIEQKEATERQLRFSQEMLGQAGRIALVGTWAIDLRHTAGFPATPVIWSSQMYNLLGYQPDELPHPTSADLLARVHPEDRARLLDTIEQALLAKQGWRAVYRSIDADGRVRTITEIGNVICDDSGRAISVLGAAMDITAQRQVSEELRDSTARLRLALAGASAGNYEWDMLTGKSTWSEEVWKLFGLPPAPDGPSADDWRRIVHPDDLPRVEEAIEDRVARGDEFDIEWRIAVPDGQPARWIMDRARPQRDEQGRIVRYLGFIIDITDRKQVEASLDRYREHLEEMVGERTASLTAARADQRRLNRALRLLSDCNLLLARADDEQSLLDELCRLIVDSGGYRIAWFGIAKHDLARSVRIVAKCGDDSGYLDGINLSWDGNQPTGNGPTGTAIRTGQTQVARNFETGQEGLPWREAAQRHGLRSSVGLPIIDQGGIEGALTLYSTDEERFNDEEIALLEEMASNVSMGLQALRMHRELERYRKNLETLVAERTHEIGELNSELAKRADEAEAANHAKSDFLATMSHEIRTPLNAVIGLTRLLAESPLDRRQRDYAAKIRGAAQALRTLIDDILDFSKIEAGALQLENHPFSLDTVLATTASVLSGGIGEKDIEALFDVAPDVPDALIGDSLRLQQVLLNLVSNAVKFTERGAIIISIHRLASTAGQAMLQFSVRDTGIGIPQDQLGRIFEVFTQADSSTSRKYGGSGLGLAISARLVKAMGGRISVSSAVNLGSELQFTVTLGVSDRQPDRTDTLPTGLRVLIVDNHALARDVLTRTCTAVGWTVSSVDSSQAALEELARSSRAGSYYDLLLSDWRMPGMDGVEMLHQARQNPEIALPLVLLMASASELALAVAASDELTLDGIVTKPCTPAALYEAVHRAWTGEPTPLLASAELPDRRLEGLHLLIAEDNELNQEMVEQILTQAGATVSIVANGQEAVDALRAPSVHFDAVLMDIQMPLMDGYTATEIIRKALGRTDLPIIAVTANARREDHEKSRQVGMIGHIAKPIDVDELLDLLGQLGKLSTSDPAPGPRESALPVCPGLNIQAGLKAFAGDAAIYGRLLREFLNCHSEDVRAARRLFVEGNAAEAARLIHALRGVGAYLQARDVAELAGAGETAIVEKGEVLPALDRLQAAMEVLAHGVSVFEVAFSQSHADTP